MQNFFSWFLESCNKNEPWLILGKGPTFDKCDKYDLTEYNIMSLNHVVSKLQVNVAHMIDWDVVEDCIEDINKNAAMLVLPWIPNVDNKLGEYNLEQLVLQHEFLNKLSQDGRLLFYNNVEKENNRFPLVRAKYFSSEAAIKLLALSGVKQVRTLGVDGGNGYNVRFESLVTKTLLANGRKSFNKQFSEMSKIIIDTGVDLSALDVSSPIKVYVATTEAQMLAVKVLEYSIRKHASMSVDVIPLHENNIPIPNPKDIDNYPRTPFSFQRFLIPQLQSYKGTAIYLDSDMQVFKDIKEVWQSPFNGNNILTVRNADEADRRPQFSVMLLDCEKINWKINEIVKQLDHGETTYEELMYEMGVEAKNSAAIDSCWNSLEAYKESKTSLLHYTDMTTQPWISTDNPLGYLWFRDLFEAIEQGHITLEYVKKHIDLGYIRPSVMYQIENKIEDSLLLPSSVKKLEVQYKPPYQGMPNLTKIRRLSYIGKALLRRLLENFGFYDLRRRVINFFWKD